MKKILFYGASVTAQSGNTGYFESVKCELEKINCDAHRVAYGGCHIDDAGFYRFESALTNDFDFVIFEWNTTGLPTYNEFKIAHILKSTLNSGAKPLFLILPQEASIINKRNAENQIHYICERFNIPLLDLRNGLTLDNFKLMVRDVVHTNEMGANLYSGKIIEFIKGVITNETAFWKNLNSIDNQALNFLKSNSRISEIIIKNGDILKINIKSFSDVYAELLIRHRIGPFSPVISINDGVLRRDLSLWDSYCHYEREHFSLILNNIDFKSAFLRDPFIVEIKISDDLPNYDSCRRPDIDFNVEKLIKINEMYSIGIDYDYEVA